MNCPAVRNRAVTFCEISALRALSEAIQNQLRQALDAALTEARKSARAGELNVRTVIHKVRFELDALLEEVHRNLPQAA